MLRTIIGVGLVSGALLTGWSRRLRFRIPVPGRPFHRNRPTPFRFHPIRNRCCRPIQQILRMLISWWIRRQIHRTPCPGCWKKWI